MRAIDRRRFLTWLGIGAGAAAVVPKLPMPVLLTEPMGGAADFMCLPIAADGFLDRVAGAFGIVRWPAEPDGMFRDRLVGTILGPDADPGIWPRRSRLPAGAAPV